MIQHFGVSMKKYLIIADREGEEQSAIYRGIEFARCYAVPVPTVLVDLDSVDRRKIEEKGRQKAQQAVHHLRTDLLAVKP